VVRLLLPFGFLDSMIDSWWQILRTGESKMLRSSRARSGTVSMSPR
jgi:hypothetical protein